MAMPTVSRGRIARTLSTVVTLALTVSVGGLSANGAAATTAETPQNVTAVSTSQADNTGTVVVSWDALVDPDSVLAIDVSLTGQSTQQVSSDTTGGAAFPGVAPGDYIAAIAFEYTDSSPMSDEVPFDVTVEPVAAPDAVSDVHGTANGADVTVSEVDAVNALHTTVATGSFTMVAGSVPDPPQDVAATSPTSDTVAVTWTPPASDGGQPVDGYDVTLAEQTRSTGGEGRDVTFDGLEAGTYTAAVTAHNANGSSESNSALVTVDGEFSPGTGQAAPTHLRASRVTEGGVTAIKWRAPKGVGLYLLLVDGRGYIFGPHRTEKTARGLRAGPAKVRLFALSENGFSNPAVIKIEVKKSVAQAPKATLKFGMHGPDVRHLQKALSMRHPTGTFGKATLAAVKDFQGFYGMRRTGEVNDRLRYLLNV
jgi:hypothetical protein